MLLKLIVELFGLVGEIAVEVLVDFAMDFVPDWLARRER
jgi:hypothetical protein